MRVYNQPLYYEIAFSFINPKKQVIFFEKLIKKYSKIKVKRVLDIACGPSLQLREMSRRGYESVGLDSSSQMLRYLKQKTKEEGVNIETVKDDMGNFRLDKKVEFAFIMMGSISNIESNEDLLSHLDSVANSLKKGGLYLIENFRLDWSSKSQSWVMKRAGIKVKTAFQTKLKNMLSQIALDTITMVVNDNGKKLRFSECSLTKHIFPEELKTLIELNGKFDFLGFFDHFKMKELKEAKNENIILLRRK